MKPTQLTEDDIGRIDAYSGTQMEFARAIEAAVNAKWEAENNRLREVVYRTATQSCITDDECGECHSCKARAALKGQS